MFGKFNMNNIMQSAQEMQKEMEKITVVGESGAGAVSIQMNARHIVSRVSLTDEIVADASTNKEVLEELITAAIKLSNGLYSVFLNCWPLADLNL